MFMLSMHLLVLKNGVSALEITSPLLQPSGMTGLYTFALEMIRSMRYIQTEQKKGV